MGNCHSGKSELYTSLTSGDSQTAAALLKSNPQYATAKRSLPQRRNVWHIAAESGQLEVLRCALQSVWQALPGPSGSLQPGPMPGEIHPVVKQALDAHDMTGATPLMLACQAGHTHVVTFLMEVGADPWTTDRFLGKCALHYAAAKNRAACIHALLSHPGVPHLSTVVSTKPVRLVNCPTGCGLTPLHYAIASRANDAALALLAHGADPVAQNWAEGHDWLQLMPGNTPLHLCARIGNLDVALAIMRHYHDHLQQQGATDPRVVINSKNLTPFNMPGVKGSPGLLRVLDPATPLQEISDPFGGDAGASAATAPALKVMPAPAKAPAPAATEGGSAGPASPQPHLADQPDEPGEGPRACHAKPADPAGAGRRPGEFALPSLPDHVLSKDNENRGQLAPKGWEDLLQYSPTAAAAAAAAGVASISSPGSQFVTVFRSPDMQQYDELSPSPSPSPVRTPAAAQPPMRAAPKHASRAELGAMPGDWPAAELPTRMSASGMMRTSGHGGAVPRTSYAGRNAISPVGLAGGQPSSGSDTAARAASAAAAALRASHGSASPCSSGSSSSSANVQSPRAGGVKPLQSQPSGLRASNTNVCVGSPPAPEAASSVSPRQPAGGAALPSPYAARAIQVEASPTRGSLLHTRSGRRLPSPPGDEFFPPDPPLLVKAPSARLAALKSVSRKMFGGAGSGHVPEQPSSAVPATTNAWGSITAPSPAGKAAGPAAAAAGGSGGQMARSKTLDGVVSAAAEACFTRDSHAATAEPVLPTAFPYTPTLITRVDAGDPTFHRTSGINQSRSGAVSR